MELIHVDPVSPDPGVIHLAAETIRRGGLVAFPTETVYGLGANALDVDAVQRIYAAKGRPAYNPLIVHVASDEMARELVRSWPSIADRLAAAFWPGPLTLVLEKRDIVPDIVTAGLATAGIRVPAHPVALELLRAAAVPIAAPSANRFTEISPTTARHVVKSLGDAVDMVLDGGPTAVGLESTVLDLTRDPPRILRPGGVSAESIAAVTGWVDRVSPPDPGGKEARRSPGTIGRHYAPRARTVLFEPQHRERAAAAARTAVGAGNRVGAVVLSDFEVSGVQTITMPAAPAAYAARLYAALHELEDAGCDTLFIENVPEGDGWLAIRDRLSRAAAPPAD